MAGKAGVSVSLEDLERLRRIVAAIEKAGQPQSATRLKRQLGITDADFSVAVSYGCNIKVIKWGDRNIYSFVKSYQVPEEAYYDWIKRGLEALWIAEGYETGSFYIENTSRIDSKIQGPWTRPDLTLVSHKKFPWTIGTEFDVVTFEIKRPDAANVLAVFEALSHVTAATRGYVVFPIEESEWRKQNPAQEQRVRDECVRHGVGLILVSSSAGDPVARHILKASRREIDHEKCSAFIDAVVSPAGKKKISEWKS